MPTFVELGEVALQMRRDLPTAIVNVGGETESTNRSWR